MQRMDVFTPPLDVMSKFKEVDNTCGYVGKVHLFKPNDLEVRTWTVQWQTCDIDDADRLT